MNWGNYFRYQATNSYPDGLQDIALFIAKEIGMAEPQLSRARRMILLTGCPPRKTLA
ncbi:hypothetical protein [Rhizobium esperanzae]|uniref:Uncharacterized protein n=1 Tax=Rhizobium esperanzae TaxID=1967781 RepID=A0A7W6W3N1_9HYPH|nr:hypothetical protein [Rhizobium esperanzae]MBB4234689.1 hypothetical protein [Rhizobium esperanzae]